MQHIQEGISRAYVTAVAHIAGMNITTTYDHDYGIDGTFYDVRLRGNERRQTGFSLDFQLKATWNATIQQNHIKYKLNAKNYNDLVDDEVGTERILILYIMPDDQTKWLSINENATVFEKCGWWLSLNGLDPTSNVESVTIEIPREQILTPESLIDLMSKIKAGEVI